MQVEKELNVQVLDKTSTHIILKEYREDQLIVIYDLVIKDNDGNIVEILGTDRYTDNFTEYNITEDDITQLVNNNGI